MDLTPASWKKSKVTKYKQYVKVGQRLWTPGQSWVIVMEVDEEKMTVRDFGDEDGEFDETFYFENLQIGWEFPVEYLEGLIELIESNKGGRDDCNQR